jgi:hypothetical protein
MSNSLNIRDDDWPALPLQEWESTYHTLHMWTQIVGKIRLMLAPLENHFWNVALYVSPRGLTTSPMPYRGSMFELEFDFVHHRLELRGADMLRAMRLEPKSVAAFYRELWSLLADAGIQVEINRKPQEVPNPILFDQDETHKAYDPEYANRLWRILRSIDIVLQQFRAQFIGKASPVHFFWGSFDICCTRFSGRRAPARKGAITAESYSHECSSLGWWPGGGEVSGPAFYAYCAPEPQGFDVQAARPPAAFYQTKMHEFLLMYDDVRQSKSPADEILAFGQSAYDAAANLAKWDRTALERNPTP